MVVFTEMQIRAIFLMLAWIMPENASFLASFRGIEGQKPSLQFPAQGARDWSDQVQRDARKQASPRKKTHLAVSTLLELTT